MKNNRVCKICKQEKLLQGYCVASGLEYYCSDECLHEVYTDEEWEGMYEDGGDNYWTEWDEDDYI